MPPLPLCLVIACLLIAAMLYVFVSDGFDWL